MADIYTPSFTATPFAAEKGNAWTADFEADLAANSTDVIYVGVVPAGVRVTGVRIIAEDTGTSVTLDVGYEPAEGALPVASLNYWWNDLDTSAAAVNAMSAAYPIQFDRPVKIRILVNAANFTGTPRIALIFSGEMIGAK